MIPVDGGVQEGLLELKPFAEKTRLQFGPRVKSLGDLQQDFVFFTPSLLYLYAGFSFENVMIQYQTGVSREDGILLYVIFEHPVFSGLEFDSDPSWNHVLWAVPQSCWGRLDEFIRSTAFISHDRQHVYRTGFRKLRLPDPLAVDQRRLPNNIEIGYYGLTSSHSIVYLRPERGRPTKRFACGDPELLAIEQAVFSNQLEKSVDFHEDLPDSGRSALGDGLDVNEPGSSSGDAS